MKLSLFKNIIILGIYFNGTGSTKPTLEKIIEKIENFIKLIQYKKLLPIQISRLFNTILAPSIEYFLQATSLTNQQINKLSTLLTKQIKRSLKLSLNTSYNSNKPFASQYFYTPQTLYLYRIQSLW